MAPCDVFFFSSILSELAGCDELTLCLTAREHAETISLLRERHIPARIIGHHDVSSRLTQLSSFIDRNLRLYFGVGDFDVSMTLANIYGVIVSRLRNRPSISIIDNDLVEYRRTMMESVAARVHASTDWIVAPRAYPIDMTIRNGADPSRVLTIDGYKEDVYVADYSPDPHFPGQVPFDRYVVIRPEALYSTYVHIKESITEELIRLLSCNGVNIVFLPRQLKDVQSTSLLKDTSRVWVPGKALNGLDLAYYSEVVLTGSGTFAREAACMNKPAVSFFPDRLLAVDRSLVESGKIYHSRNPSEILEYVLSKMDRGEAGYVSERSIQARSQFLAIVRRILEEEALE